MQKPGTALCNSAQRGSRLQYPNDPGAFGPQIHQQDYDLHLRFEPGRQACEEPSGQLVRKKAQRVIRKPYNTQDGGQMRFKPLIKKGLREDLSSVLSGSKNPNRVYLETI